MIPAAKKQAYSRKIVWLQEMLWESLVDSIARIMSVLKHATSALLMALYVEEEKSKEPLRLVMRAAVPDGHQAGTI